MDVTFAQVHSLTPGMIPEYAAAFDAAGVNDILGKYRISDSGLRLAHFFAQMLEETGGFHVQIESLRYSPSRLMEVWPHRFPTLDIAEQYAYNEEKLGNYVYGGRLGNTNPGDGFRYRGRGLLQITGRAAYAKYGQQLGIDLEGTPELAFHRDHCLEIAAAEWAASGYGGKNCNQLADRDDIVGVTYAINGGQTGIADRRSWLKKTRAIWAKPAAAASDTMTSRANANLEAAMVPAPYLGAAPAMAPAAAPAGAGAAAAPSGFGARAANIAIGEWHRFGEQTYDISGQATHVGHKEAQDPYYRYVGEYWSFGVGDDTLTGLNTSVPWSAAFISWVMKTAGAGTRFNYYPAHSYYISRAIRDLQHGKTDAGYYCYPLGEWKPQVGDIVCWAREAGIDYQHQNGGHYKGHCDIVVEVVAGQVQIVGGNVGDSVTKRPLGLTGGGYLQAVIEGGENLFGIMRCRL
ncbi:DUF2272 domain-containing protein [Bradyrhizobium tunisiense]|uniref:DUF2272 domain-containing protein n=1 Tax=Bradyrhizobium tunisiense TaxID=3278709 RepID=UPI0035DCD33B